MKLSAKAEASLHRVVERMRAGDLSPLVFVAGLRREPPVPFDTWSYRNRVVAYAQSDSTDLRTYRAWQEIGRQVKAGSHAAWILTPHMKKVIDDRTGEQSWLMAGFTPSPRHPVEDTEGEPLEVPSITSRTLPPLWEVAGQLGVSVRYMPNLPGILGNCGGGRIHLDSDDPSVWFHELAHALHTHLDGGERRGGRAQREAVADFTACVLMEFYGLGDRTGNTWRYIQHYHQDPLQAIAAALGTVTCILEFLFPGEAWENGSGGDS